jgi:arylsulfatase A-like enzyme/predicted Zn-dependent protease
MMKPRSLSPLPTRKRFTPKQLTVAGILTLALLLTLLALWPLLRHWQQQRRLRNLNVILITIDTLRADYVGAYGAGRANTPTLDALASEGVRFNHCIAQTPLTLPSHTSILSATYPLFHRVRDNGAFRVPQTLPLVSEVLQKNNFDTAAFIGAYVLHGKWGLNRGFTTYSDRFDMGRYGRIMLQNEKRADEVLGDTRRWLERRPAQKRFFAWIHLYDPHSPYSPPPPFDTRFPDDPFRGEVEYTDSELGKFFNFLKEKGLYDNCLIIVTADHGEGLGEHGEMEHGYFLYESTVHVPLIMRAPVPFNKSAVTEIVQLVDLAPTIADILGVQAPAQWQGRSLRPLLEGQPDSWFNKAYSETYYPRFHYGWSQLQALYHKQRKYILAPRDELYDLSRDPQETRDRTMDSSRSDMRGRLMAFVSLFSRGALSADSAHKMTQQDQQRLAALGYLSGMVQVNEQTPLADPKDKLPINNALAKAVTLVSNKNWQEAVDSLRRIVAAEPELADGWSILGNAYLGLRRQREALNAFRRALKLKPDNNFLMLNIITTMTTLGEYEAAATETALFLKIFPQDAALLEKMGNLRFLQNRPDEALNYLRQAYTIDPAASQSFNLAGEALIMKKDYAAAETILRQGIRENPRAKNTHYLLAQVQESLGRTDQALESYRQELEINPEKYQAAVNLANYYKQAGQMDEAARYYRMAIDNNGKLKLPRFHLAEIMLKKGENMQEAVDLCLKGIDVLPRDRETLFGYFVLTNLYAALGNAERCDFYTRAGEKLIATLGL